MAFDRHISIHEYALTSIRGVAPPGHRFGVAAAPARLAWPDRPARRNISDENRISSETRF